MLYLKIYKMLLMFLMWSVTQEKFYDLFPKNTQKIINHYVLFIKYLK